MSKLSSVTVIFCILRELEIHKCIYLSKLTQCSHQIYGLHSILILLNIKENIELNVFMLQYLEESLLIYPITLKCIKK